MSEEQAHPASQAAPATGDPPDAGSAPETGQAPVRRAVLVVGALIVLSLTWHLLADRFTPYTSQARIQGYVVGVAPKVAGELTDVWTANNAEVEEGDRLFAIDRAQYEIALNRAQSDLENARRQVGAGDATVDAARAGLAAARANALEKRQNASRLERLYAEDPGTISLRRLEAARASLERAEAQVRAAEADIRRATEQMGGADAESNSILNTAMTAVEKAALDLDNTIVTAPAKGIITDLRAEVGQFAGTGTPIMTLIAIRDVWISAEFTENNLGHLAPGTPVDILFDAIPGRLFPGRIRSLGLGISSGQSPPPGTLPTIQNSRDWLRPAQRFPVVVEFNPTSDPELLRQLRIGGQTSVIAYTEGHGVLRLIGRAYLRLLSWFSYLG